MAWVDVPIGCKTSEITRITQAIYAHCNLPVPAGIDHRWRSPQIQYLVVDQNALEPKKCIINLGEGEPDSPPRKGAHFKINLDIMQVTDKWARKNFPPPHEIRGSLKEIRDFAVAHCRQAKEAKKQYAIQERERKEAKLRKEREDISAFHMKLVRNGVIGQEEIDSVTHGRTRLDFCPACIAIDRDEDQSKPPPSLTKCSGCHSYVCLTRDCKAYELDEPKRCFHSHLHTQETYCKECILRPTKLVGHEPRLRRCPVDGCDRWMCKWHWEWCSGEPVDSVEATNVDSASDVEDSEDEQHRVKKRKKDPQPRHERRLAPCSLCIQRVDWKRCDSSQCWAGRGLICPDCSSDGGIRCVENHTWICDLCAYKDLPTVWSCPSCKKFYCDDCNSIKRCVECGVSQECESCCLENENKPGQTEAEDVELVSPCNADGCDYLLCAPCVAEGNLEHCGICSERVCDNHVSRCRADCGKALCSGCVENYPRSLCSACWEVDEERLGEAAFMKAFYGEESPYY